METILVIKNDVLSEIFKNKTGFIKDDGEFKTSELFDEKNCWFGPREYLENDPSFRQFIPYIILKSGDRIFYYRRGKKGSEQRLHDLYSVGFGGHINVMDAVTNDERLSVIDTVEESIFREIHEELDLDMLPIINDLKYIGYIIDNTNDVGKVHLAIVCMVEIDEDTPISTENCIKEIQLDNIQNVKKLNLESWSNLCIDHI